MIKFDNWHIENEGEILARQYDNLTRELRVEGSIPEGWTWDLLVQAGENMDIIGLSQEANSLAITLTAEMLALPGYYTLQLRAAQGEKVRHTNMIRVYVPASLSGDAQWPEVPSEFTQVEQNIFAINNHPPMPGENGCWLIYDPAAGAYQESDIPLPGGGGGMDYQIGHGLKVTGTNTLEVDTAEDAQQDNTLPITSAAVYSTVGNIEILLRTI
ncbi:hypothetical protein [uncultured Flavonifractor sp.]|uniref:hypothetical protein n=1 Tax=uncultured Flavonifractor sp. TaxID=1193534 RepID=UPI00261603EC|nr:hypothetical protein [uncultured Flavonifractor sp.]